MIINKSALIPLNNVLGIYSVVYVPELPQNTTQNMRQIKKEKEAKRKKSFYR